METIQLAYLFAVLSVASFTVLIGLWIENQYQKEYWNKPDYKAPKHEVLEDTIQNPFRNLKPIVIKMKDFGSMLEISGITSRNLDNIPQEYIDGIKDRLAKSVKNAIIHGK